MAAVEQIKNHFVILSNRSKRPLIAYSVMFSLYYANGGTQFICTRFWDPFYPQVGDVFIRGSSDVLLPGQVKITSMGLVLNQGPEVSESDVISVYKRQLQKFRPEAITRMNAAVDCAIDSEGIVSGEDAGKLGEDFQAAVEEGRSVFGDVANALENGLHLPEILDGLKTRLLEMMRKPHTSTRAQQYQSITAGDILALAKAVNATQFIEVARRVNTSAGLRIRRG